MLSVEAQASLDLTISARSAIVGHLPYKGFFVIKTIRLTAIVIAVTLPLASCVSMNLVPSGPQPGTAGFYTVEPVAGRIVTEETKARRMSQPGERFFVYRVNDDSVVLGEGNEDAKAKVKPFDEVTRGVIITNDEAKRLAAYLDKVIGLYDATTKAISVYLDFQLLSQTPETQRAAGSPEEYIRLRFQYTLNVGAIETVEATSYYLGSSVRKVEYQDLLSLSASLKKP